MRKLFVALLACAILLPAAAVSAVPPAEFLPSKPATFPLSLPEHMLSRIPIGPAVISESNWHSNAVAAIMKYRLLNDCHSFRSDAVTLRIDTVTPDFISAQVASPDVDPDSVPLPCEDVATLQVAVLRRNKKNSLGVAALTTRPGDIPATRLSFYEFPSLQTMNEEEEAQSNEKSELMRFIVNHMLKNDSTLLPIYNIAADAGLVRPVTYDESDPPIAPITLTPRQLKSRNFIKEPAIIDFFSIPEGREGERVRQAIAEIPFPMISYVISPDDLSLTATLHYDRLVSLEASVRLDACRRPPLRYIWDGKKYKKSER